ncbi:hypothetical protein L208DRAFT_1278180 [Tricholoma matsutake]|nr:hypothetical protein L208DRAFT_1278180 [Tricholoma matsutake 945]
MFDNDFEVIRMENPVLWCLLKWHANNGTMLEEAMFSLQGIIKLKDLLPFQEKPK